MSLQSPSFASQKRRPAFHGNRKRRSGFSWLRSAAFHLADRSFDDESGKWEDSDDLAAYRQMNLIIRGADLKPVPSPEGL